MHSRGSRVYVLLAIMSVIMFLSLILDITVKKTSDRITADGVVKSNNFIENINNIDNTVEITTDSVSEEEKAKIVSDFYKNTVFVGDSIMSGFSTFASKKEAPEFISNLIFLSASSYGVDAALNGESLVYKGEQKALLDSLTEINPDKIFINLGVNELDGVKAEKVGKKYGKLIEDIKSALPDTDIYILGVTYFVKGKETPTYNNNGIREFNDYIKSNAENWGITYLDLPSKLSDSEGYLPVEYASDKRIHHNNEAYKKWVEFLEETALIYNA